MQRTLGRTLFLRLAQGLVVLWAAYTLAFLLLGALPSDAVMARYADPSLGLNEAQLAEIREQQGLDRPFLLRYALALVSLIRGDLGYSAQTGTPVRDILSAALPGTFALAGVGLVCALLLATLVAVVASMPRLGVLSRLCRSLPGLLVSLPSFWVGIILIQLLSFRLGLVPVVEPSPVQSLILPALTLSIPVGAPLAHVLIHSIDEVRRQPYVQVLRARGASEEWILFRDVFRAAALPVLTMAGVVFGELIAGAVVTETVFGRRGLGSVTVDAVAARDTPVLLAVVIITATAFVFINLIVDLSYPRIDPRLRTLKEVNA